MPMADFVASRRDEGADNTKRSGTRAPTLARVSTHRISFSQGTRTRSARGHPALRGLNFGVDYRHAVEFSRNSRTPREGSFDPVRGQPPNCTLLPSFVNGRRSAGYSLFPAHKRPPQAAACEIEVFEETVRETVHQRCPLLPIGRREATLRQRDEAMQIRSVRRVRARLRRRQQRAFRGARPANGRAGSPPARGPNRGRSLVRC
jgi:hypothetical protein